MLSDGELFLRLVLSCVLGGIIGYERQSRRKSAGLRTNVLVCLGSCLIMVMSIGLYQDVEGKTNADPARLAAQVVSGIGFLGAGAIMKEGLSVTGLTTAACLWVVAGVGLAVGAGFYAGALISTALVFVTLGSLSRLDDWVDHEKNLSLNIHTVDRPGQLMRISRCLEDLQLRVRGVKVKADEDEVDETGDSPVDAFVNCVKHIMLKAEEENGTLKPLTARGNGGTYIYNINGKAFAAVMDVIVEKHEDKINAYLDGLSAQKAKTMKYVAPFIGAILETQLFSPANMPKKDLEPAFESVYGRGTSAVSKMAVSNLSETGKTLVNTIKSIANNP